MYNIYSDEEKFTEAVKNTPQVTTLYTLHKDRQCLSSQERL
jgi:hypothetical protein